MCGGAVVHLNTTFKQLHIIHCILPAYNEDLSVISQTIQQIIDKDYACILVDDGSFQPFALPFSSDKVHVIRHIKNKGQGASLQTGMNRAKMLKADFIIHFDADGQHRVEDIPVMLAPLFDGKYDICFGSRFMNEEFAQSVPAIKKGLLNIARMVNFLFTSLWMTDAHCGFRALNKKAYTAILLKEKRMAHATEILWEVKRHDLRWCEVPVKVIYKNKTPSSFFTELKRGIYILFRLFYRKCIRL